MRFHRSKNGNRSAECGALVRFEAFQPAVEDRGQNLAHEIAAGDAA